MVGPPRRTELRGGFIVGIAAESVLDYHDGDRPRRVVELTAGRGVDDAANVARGGASQAMAAVRDGGRLATITSDRPDPARGIRVDSVFVRPDGPQLESACDAHPGQHGPGRA